jgi:FAD-dependent urate hydroxylase
VTGSTQSDVRVKDRIQNGRRSPSIDYDVTIIGAGPYGLSAAAHLKAIGLGVQIFGQPMEFWADKMPEGMLLRSPRPASTISDPRSAFTLEAFEAEAGLPPSSPVPLKTFVDYGRWFQQQLGPCLDRSNVSRVTREGSKFRIDLQNGESVTSARVVVAAGVGSFRRKPAPFADLPATLVSHCYEGRRIREFAGKSVAVVGAGQSALESAALLHEAGADVEIIARNQQLRWIGQHPWLHRLGPISQMLYAKPDVGPAGISRLVAMPKLVYRFPSKLKDKIRTRAVRPAGSAWLPARLGNVKVTTGRAVQAARTGTEKAHLLLDDGSERQVDHVLLGTGYRVDIGNYSFLAEGLRNEIRQLDGYPEVGPGFCSSVPGLHFIGATAARNFGPLLYFVVGTEFASKELTARMR